MGKPKKNDDDSSESEKEEVKKPKSKGKKKGSKKKSSSTEAPRKGSGSMEGGKGSKEGKDKAPVKVTKRSKKTNRAAVDEGQFLLRKDLMEKQTTAADEPILLSVRSGQQVINAIIKEVPSGFRVCDREFDTVSAAVDYYQIRKIPINITEEIEVTLGNPVRRKAWELRHKMITVQKELGSGSYGVVYLALLTYPRQKPITVAAKMLTDMDHDSSLALWKEARVMQEYDHPNITKFYGVCNDALPYYLVMEFISGGSVDNYLKLNPKLNIFKRTKIAMEAAAGLDYLHSRLCIHRDIAARNLLIDKVAKVSDFGLTRKTRNYKIDPDKPMNLRWIAPDVFETSSVNKATDVYAYGITLFELFVVPYDIPYSQWEADEVYTKVVENGFRLTPPREMPKEVSGLMKECLLPPQMRPTFRMIHIFLSALHKKMQADGLEDEGKKKFKLFG
ncbi:hypothetical protein PRIPAC_84467 [Pristionchus pacificus]|uniref:Non-specific protein-tyrosine kinase n=1 Tax=Pristionchus pacificus TaxID=54126 RepID=A0A2A6CCH2_PRIPA|nr:hypothetical protein PRIPAC_84467 [Pristionchus pacificus]|eukprot:PDM75711.1 protein kinase [Pristionchus pacificus]